MKIQIRNDVVVIEGYVNAVERDSRVLRDSSGQFIEKIKAGAFQRALDRAKRASYDVKVLLNHNYCRELTSTKEPTTIIVEDSIGLRCKCEIRDAEVVDKAKSGKLVGWSFGFIPIRTSRDDAEIAHREVSELELREISILDDTRTPAYTGTSIELRDEFDELIEIRTFDDTVEIEECTEKHNYDNHEYENRYMEIRVGV